jgi:hypothetical protein
MHMKLKNQDRISQKWKAWAWCMLHWILPNILRTNSNTFWTLPQNKMERTLPNSFYGACITLIPNPDKDSTKKREQQANLYEHRCKNPQWNIDKFNSAHIKKIIHHDSVGFILGM